MNLSTSSFTFVKKFFWFILWSNCTSCMHTCYLFLPASHTCHYLRCLLISVRFLSEATMGRWVLSTSGPKLEGWALPLNLNLMLWLKEFWEFWKVWGRGFFFFFEIFVARGGLSLRRGPAVLLIPVHACCPFQQEVKPTSSTLEPGWPSGYVFSLFST